MVNLTVPVDSFLSNLDGKGATGATLTGVARPLTPKSATAVRISSFIVTAEIQ